MFYTVIMTVILAGVYDEGKGVIIVADKMRTASHIFMDKELEIDNEEITKINPLNDHVYVAYSGNEEFWHTVLKEVRAKVHPTDKVRKVVRIIETAYRRQHNRYLEGKVLSPLGFESIKDYNTRANIELPPARIDQIDRQLRETFGTGELVLVGCEDGKYDVYGLRDPGILELNPHGQAIVGSGAKSATQPVTERHRTSMNKDEVKTILLDAKKLAEQDKGVGKLTQIVELPL